MPPSSRTVRVFLSSTFRDFAEERDLLVRKVFPELRRKCRERQVELVDVDLRWGITEKEAQQGKVLPICLAEIDRARPYFMGFIGERYGWVPEKQQYDLSLLQEQPWLEEHRGGKSVTELEMLHGVLNNPAMADRAFFYFRDPAYSQSKGGAYLSESAQDMQRLEDLKDRILHSGFPVMQDYATPEVLAQRLEEDLWRLIDAAFPLEDVPDALSLERKKHEAYGGSRLGMYLGGADYFKFLDGALAHGESFKPVLITGASGGGKSALVANWTRAFIQKHTNTLLHVHYLGSGADAADSVKLVTRLLQELARITGDELKLESDPQKLFDLLPEWLARASCYAQKDGKVWLLVFDGLDKLSSMQDLRWWPTMLPPNVKLVASCLEGAILLAVQKRMEWNELEVHSLSNEDQRQFIYDYLGKYRKSLTPPQTRRVQNHPLSGNPLFLRTLLEELRVFGVHEELEQKLTHYLQSRTVDDLFEQVLERIEEDTSSKDVCSAMEAIWASRAGLAQDELLAITGLVPATWAPIHNALDEAILESGGRLMFGHDYLRKAVGDRYLLREKRRRQAHVKLARWFEKQEVSGRVAEELPWQWQQANEDVKLKKCLTQRAMFEVLNKRDQYELLGYWLGLKNVDLEKAYGLAWKTWTSQNDHELVKANTASQLAGFLKVAGYYGVLAEALLRRTLDGFEKVFGSEHPKTLECVNNLGHLLGLKGEYERWQNWREKGLLSQDRDYGGAESLIRRALEVRERILGLDHPDTLSSVNTLGGLLYDKSDFKGAEALYRRAMDGFEKIFGPEHPKTLDCVNNLGVLLSKKSDYDGAESLYRLALEVRQKILGAEHPKTLSCINNLGILLSRKSDYEGSKTMYRRALDGFEKVLGSMHPNTLNCFIGFGKLLNSMGDKEAEEALYRRELVAKERAFGPGHLDTLGSVVKLGISLSDKGDYEGAEALYRRGLAGFEKALGQEHRKTLRSVKLLGKLLHRKGDYEGAAALLRRWISVSAAEGIRYNLACYECLSGNVIEARRLLAEEFAEMPSSLDYALTDADLMALRGELPSLAKHTPTEAKATNTESKETR